MQMLVPVLLAMLYAFICEERQLSLYFWTDYIGSSAFAGELVSLFFDSVQSNCYNLPTQLNFYGVIPLTFQS